MILLILFLGILFGFALQYASLNKYNVVSGLALRENFAVAKAIAIAIGVGAIFLNIEIALGMSSYHVKPFIVGGLILGGLIFGSGMAILGYCPGTMAISLGEGSLDALLGIVGGLFAGVFYTLVVPFITAFFGPNLGKLSLNSIIGTNTWFFIALLIVGVAFIFCALWLQKIDKDRSKKWILAGIALAVLNLIIFSSFVTNRPIGASTSYPYLSDLIFGVTNNAYFNKIEVSGNWELIFLAGAFISGIISTVIRKDFKFKLLPENWVKYKGNSPKRRILWAFIGGFILIFGARIAGGCTSGHILSGGMQLALSSLTFAVFVFVGLLVTGQLFYKGTKK